MKKKICVMMFALLFSMASCNQGGTSEKVSSSEPNKETTSLVSSSNKPSDSSTSEKPSSVKEETSSEVSTSVEAKGFEVGITKDEHVKDLKVYLDQALTKEDTSGKYYSRNSTTGEKADVDGQINFTFKVDEGYVVDSVTCVEGTYKNIKVVDDSGNPYVYRVTKITADTVITIKTKVAEVTPVDPPVTPVESDDYTNGFNDQTDVALKDSQEFKDFWNYASDVQIGLSFKEDVFSTMCSYQGKSMPQFADIYFPADLTIKMNDTVYEFEEVGVRLKGNTSRRTMLDSQGNVSQAAHLKISLKATFDDELYDKDPEIAKYKKTWEDATLRTARKNRNLFDMEKFDLKYVSRNSSFGFGWGGGGGSDGCYAREVVAFDMFRKEGLLAPHANICSVNINNGKSNKTFTYESIECVDKVFLKRHFSKADAKGDLYKCGVQNNWIADFSKDGAISSDVDENGKSIGTRVANGKIGVEVPYDSYFPSYQLKTNDNGEDSDFSKMTNLINTIQDCVNKKGTQEELESKIDMDNFLKFSAVSFMIGNFDDLRYNTNNSYIYFVPSTGKAYVVAYDYDWCLGLTTMQKMESLDPFNTWTMCGNISNLYKATIYKGDETSYSKDAYQTKYMMYMKESLENGIMDTNYLDKLLGKIVYKNSSSTEATNIAKYMNSQTSNVTKALESYK